MTQPRYASAVLADGDVPLARATAFIALAQEVTQEALLRHVDALLAAAPPEPETTSGPVSAPSGPRPVTVAEQLPAPLRSRTDEIGDETGGGPTLSGYELFQAVTRDPAWAARFAAVMVVAEAEDGAWLPVTEAEASAERFPARAFAEAWEPFFEVSSRLTDGLLGLPSGSASPSTRPTTAPTPAERIRA